MLFPSTGLTCGTFPSNEATLTSGTRITVPERTARSIAETSFETATTDAYSVPCAPDTNARTGPGFVYSIRSVHAGRDLDGPVDAAARHGRGGPHRNGLVLRHRREPDRRHRHSENRPHQPRLHARTPIFRKDTGKKKAPGSPGPFRKTGFGAATGRSSSSRRRR